MLDLLTSPQAIILATMGGVAVITFSACQALFALSGYVTEATRAKRDHADAARDIGRASLIAAEAYARALSTHPKHGSSTDD